MAVSFKNKHASYHIPLTPILRKWFSTTIDSEDFILGKISYTLLNDSDLHSINMEFLNHDTLTDIITFDYNKGNIVFGEIYISLDRVEENAILHSVHFEFELYRILIHGLLHLLGYKDKAPEDKKLMTRKEDYYLSLLPQK